MKIGEGSSLTNRPDFTRSAFTLHAASSIGSTLGSRITKSPTSNHYGPNNAWKSRSWRKRHPTIPQNRSWNAMILRLLRLLAANSNKNNKLKQISNVLLISDSESQVATLILYASSPCSSYSFILFSFTDAQGSWTAATLSDGRR